MRQAVGHAIQKSGIDGSIGAQRDKTGKAAHRFSQSVEEKVDRGKASPQAREEIA